MLLAAFYYFVSLNMLTTLYIIMVCYNLNFIFVHLVLISTSNSNIVLPKLIAETWRDDSITKKVRCTYCSCVQTHAMSPSILHIYCITGCTLLIFTTNLYTILFLQLVCKKSALLTVLY